MITSEPSSAAIDIPALQPTSTKRRSHEHHNNLIARREQQNPLQLYAHLLLLKCMAGSAGKERVAEAVSSTTSLSTQNNVVNVIIDDVTGHNDE